MSIVLQGSTSGSVTLQEPAVAGSTVLTLPAVSGTVLTTGSSGQSIPKAALPTGSVLQVVQSTYAVSTTISTGTATSTGLTATITPTFSTSKILVLITDQIRTTSGYGQFYVYRNSTNIYTVWASFNYSSNSGAYSGTLATNYLDSPATTSSTSYTLYFSNVSGITAQIDGTVATMTLLEIAA
jgi:hypothetical protein